jgi:hypothetical protein
MRTKQGEKIGGRRGVVHREKWDEGE